MKTCAKCLTAKCAALFSKRKNGKDGLCYWCKACFKIYGAKYYAANTKKCSLASAKYYAANRDDLPGSRVVELIVRHTKIPREMIPISLIEAVRVSIQIKRKLKELSK